MNLDLFSFFNQLLTRPLMATTVILTVGVMFVNGWTDAPNAVATCIATRALRPKTAVALSAIFNFLGVFVMTAVNSSVVFTVQHAVNFGNDTTAASIALCAALCAIILWAVAAWSFGIPTSESHALIAGLSGAAIALQNGLAGINSKEWTAVIVGLFLSVLCGFIGGFLMIRCICRCLFRGDRLKTIYPFRRAQIVGCAAMSFMHGAQDGQKFIAVFLLSVVDTRAAAPLHVPLWMILLCSTVMTLGTSLGGYKIIRAVGMNLVRLQPHEGFCADIAAASCLLFSSVFGLPVSTTHAKTAAIVGVGAAKRLSAVNFRTVREMSLAWLLTFPGCGLLGFLVAKLFLQIFT